ncbi:hypothetical protein C0Q70_07423 [Pomacea canaliculata]|uniref:Receptor-binding cancer antigen expressed on SiSo cells n=2 Tax=Pomacea canaliculata TaxID=400727 RepID=A0A2T7PF05_POMCA|nr:hypothetical protein C0Q70_07423 [Pomacea canaliculata]
MDKGIPMATSQSMTIDIPQSFPSGEEPDIVMESWDIWDSTQPQVVQNSQSNTRTGLMGLQTTNHSVRGRRLDSDTEPEPEPDYFQDMEPDFRRPAKILIKKKENKVNMDIISSRLAAIADSPPVGSELETWDDNEQAWNEEIGEDLSWEAEAAIREKRRVDRQERTIEQQMKKQQRNAIRTTKKDSHIAVKIS